MTRLMRDSTTAADIPTRGLDLVAGYGNGLYKWSDADWARFGGRPHVRIDVNGSDPNGCSVLDVERGDATPAHAPGWAKRRHQLHHDRPTIYCNRSTQAAVEHEMAKAGLHLAVDYHLWIATGDGTEILPDMTGVVAVQARWQAQTGGHWDESVVYDDHWHPAPAPKPAPTPEPVPLDGEVVWLEAGRLHARGVVSEDAGKTWR